jgi:hypothetical protein
MTPGAPFTPGSPPELGPGWSVWIVVVAALFLMAVFAFYYYLG